MILAAIEVVFYLWLIAALISLAHVLIIPEGTLHIPRRRQ